MSKQDCIEIDGVVDEVCPGAIFKVKIANGHIITTYLSGKLHMHNIKVLEGDKVKVEMSPYDMTKGRITWREKN